MKKNANHSKVVNRISSLENLPLLRGMFIYPGSIKPVKNSYIKDLLNVFPDGRNTFVTTGRVPKLMNRNAGHSCTSEEGLFLTPEEGQYLGI